MYCVIAMFSQCLNYVQYCAALSAHMSADLYAVAVELIYLCTHLLRVLTKLSSSFVRTACCHSYPSEPEGARLEHCQSLFSNTAETEPQYFLLQECGSPFAAGATASLSPVADSVFAAISVCTNIACRSARFAIRADSVC